MHKEYLQMIREVNNPLSFQKNIEDYHRWLTNNRLPLAYVGLSNEQFAIITAINHEHSRNISFRDFATVHRGKWLVKAERNPDTSSSAQPPHIVAATYPRLARRQNLNALLNHARTAPSHNRVIQFLAKNWDSVMPLLYGDDVKSIIDPAVFCEVQLIPHATVDFIGVTPHGRIAVIEVGHIKSQKTSQLRGYIRHLQKLFKPLVTYGLDFDQWVCHYDNHDAKNSTDLILTQK